MASIEAAHERPGQWSRRAAFRRRAETVKICAVNEEEDSDSSVVTQSH